MSAPADVATLQAMLAEVVRQRDQAQARCLELQVGFQAALALGRMLEAQLAELQAPPEPAADPAGPPAPLKH